MAVDVLNEIVIEQPCAEVAAYVGDPSHAPDWYASIECVTWQTPAPAQLGSKVDLVARFLGRRLAYTYEIVDLVPGRTGRRRGSRALIRADFAENMQVAGSPGWT